jgi:hypothetical protein
MLLGARGRDGLDRRARSQRRTVGGARSATVARSPFRKRRSAAVRLVNHSCHKAPEIDKGPRPVVVDREEDNVSLADDGPEQRE